jgi:serine/threonine protein kinase
MINEKSYYIAPEIVNNIEFDEKVDEKVDVWSLGCILFNLLIGDLMNVEWKYYFFKREKNTT